MKDQTNIHEVVPAFFMSLIIACMTMAVTDFIFGKDANPVDETQYPFLAIMIIFSILFFRWLKSSPKTENE